MRMVLRLQEVYASASVPKRKEPHMPIRGRPHQRSFIMRKNK